MATILPRAVRDLASELTRLPGIGPKTAQRLAIHLLRQPFPVVAKLANNLKDLHANVRICQRCFNLSEQELCLICRDTSRDQSLVCVVEDALDVEALEKTDTFNGLYHVLGGVLSPLHGIGPEQIALNELLLRLKQEPVQELIIALDHTLESEATVHYIASHLGNPEMKITRLARGLPTGGDIEFADALTLTSALSGRREVKHI